MGGEKASNVLTDLTSAITSSFIVESTNYSVCGFYERITGVKLSKQSSVNEEIGPGSSSPRAFL